ncbi:MAG TPA: substrate-binding domain-containing protein, partial [Victivallales bacterium]|nr:substrate-binding domain-containing protein [Victivallales bacterium]
QPSRLIEINKTLHSCACIFCYAVDETMVRSLANSQKVVTINAPEYSIHNAGNVICDFDSGYIDATNYVISTGRTRVAILSDYYTECVELGKPLLKFGKVPETLADSGLKLVSPRNVPSFRNEAELADFLSRSRKNKVDAVFCENDVIAAKLYSILASMGYRIPEDVLIIGCDANIPLEGCLSMKIDCADIAKKAVSVLRKLFEGEGKSIIELSIPYLVNSKGKRII